MVNKPKFAKYAFVAGQAGQRWQIHRDGRQYARARRQQRGERQQVGQLIELDELLQLDGQLRLVALGGQHEQPYDGLAGLTLGQTRTQPLPGLPVHREREHRISQHPARECAGLAPERADQVAVVRYTNPWRMGM